MSGTTEESDAGYRRGLVLGLTLAEVSTLIIFVLLLLIGFEQIELNRCANSVPLTKDEWQVIQHERNQLREILAAVSLSPASPSEDFSSLVRELVTLTESGDLESALREIEEETKKLERIRAELSEVVHALDRDDSSGPVEIISLQARHISDLENQKEQLVQRLGNGLVYPSCWYDSEGRIQYIYSVNLVNEGLRLREISHADRKAHRARLPFPEIDSSQTLSPDQFHDMTQPLFDWSRRNKCRFLVRIHDGTGPQEKQKYKSLMKVVESNFYKFESIEQADF